MTKRTSGSSSRRLRVVHAVRSDSYGGVERYLATVAPALAAAGVDVAVLGGAADRMPSELGVVEWRPAVRTRDVIVELIRLGRADIHHVHMTAAELAAVLARPVTRSSVVATRHFTSARGASLPGRVAARLIDRTLAAEVAISEAVARWASDRCHVIANGVADQPAARPVDRRVLVAQRLESEKETALALDAWAASALGPEGWRLAIAGSGSEEVVLRAKAERLGVGASVEWLGQLDDAGAAMDQSAIFLAPSRREGFGLAVVEAMARALPVVAADASAHRETVGSATPHLLFEPGNPQEAAELLRRLASDEGERCRAGLTNQQVQRDRYSLERHVDALLRLYSQVAA